MTIHIRLATPHDYSAIATIGRESQNLHEKAHPETFNKDTPGFTEEHIRHLIEGEHTAVYVAEEDNTILGYALLNVHPLSYFDIFKPQTIAEISDIAVTDTMRGKGVGYLLFEAAKPWAESKGAQRLELNVWEFNKDARAFYERQGMQTLHRTMTLPIE
jgi:GNAT superfamily N-acetyltransferase